MKKSSFIALSILSGFLIQSCQLKKQVVNTDDNQATKNNYDEDDVYYVPKHVNDTVALNDSLIQNPSDSVRRVAYHHYYYHDYYYHHYYYYHGCYYYGSCYNYYGWYHHHGYPYPPAPYVSNDPNGHVYGHRRGASERLASNHAVATSGSVVSHHGMMHNGNVMSSSHASPGTAVASSRGGFGHYGSHTSMSSAS